MDSNIAHIAWRMESLAAQLEAPPDGDFASGPDPDGFLGSGASSPYRSARAAPAPPGRWAQGLLPSPAATAYEASDLGALAEACERAVIGVVRRMQDAERRLAAVEGAQRLRAGAGGQYSPPPIPIPSARPEARGPAPVTSAEVVAEVVGALGPRLDAYASLGDAVCAIGEQLGTLSGMVTRLSSVAAEPPSVLDALHESLARLAQLEARLASPLASARAVTDVARRIDGLGARLEQLEARRASSAADAAEPGAGDAPHAGFDVRDLTNEIAGEIDSLGEKLDACAQMGDTVSAIGARVEMLYLGLERLEQQASRPTPALEMLVEQAAQIELLTASVDACAQMGDTVSAIGARVEMLYLGLERLEQQASRPTPALEMLVEQAAQIELLTASVDACAQMGDTVSAIGARVEGIGRHVDELVVRVESAGATRASGAGEDPGAELCPPEEVGSELPLDVLDGLPFDLSTHDAHARANGERRHLFRRGDS